MIVEDVDMGVSDAVVVVLEIKISDLVFMDIEKPKNVVCVVMGAPNMVFVSIAVSNMLFVSNMIVMGVPSVVVDGL